jgi:hypothetical protein
VTFVPTYKDFEMQWDEDHLFRFFESEDGYIFAFDHADPQELVAEVREYDRVCGGVDVEGEDYDGLIPFVRHTWAVVVEGGIDDDWRFQYGDKYISEKGAFPLTVIAR